MQEFTRRRFWLACFFSATSTIALFLDKLSGGEYIAALTAILGLYGVAAWREMQNG
jgi:hypothetical protein